jgi:hypothetical protein
MRRPWDRWDSIGVAILAFVIVLVVAHFALVAYLPPLPPAN